MFVQTLATSDAIFKNTVYKCLEVLLCVWRFFFTNQSLKFAGYFFVSSNYIWVFSGTYITFYCEALHTQCSFLAWLGFLSDKSCASKLRAKKKEEKKLTASDFQLGLFLQQAQGSERKLSSKQYGVTKIS